MGGDWRKSLFFSHWGANLCFWVLTGGGGGGGGGKGGGGGGKEIGNGQGCLSYLSGVKETRDLAGAF